MTAQAAHVWSDQEKGVLARAAARACSCGCERPWRLRVDGPRVEVMPRSSTLDESNRERVLASGCAVAALVQAVRVLGWWPEAVVGPAREHGDPVSCLTAMHRYRPTAADVRHFRAVFARPRHHHTLDPTDPDQLAPALRAEILRVAATPEGRVVDVGAIVPAHRKRGVDPGLLVVTAVDGRHGQWQAGVALQRAWLAAVARGLTVEPVLEPFAGREFRQRMARHAGVEGSPQALLLLGRPDPVPYPRPPR